MTKAQKAEKAEALARLREWLKPGDTVYTICEHVSTSGMSRAIRVVLPTVADGRVEFLHPNHAVGLVLGLRHWTRRGHKQDALVVGGCGMDMGFHLVNSLSYAVFPEYDCIGEGCPSSEHRNHRYTCSCGHDRYSHETLEHFRHGACETDGCSCKAFDLIPHVDHRGKGVRHSDGYALNHRWL